MDIEQAVKTLNLRKGFDEGVFELFFVERPTDVTMFKVKSDYANKMVAYHQDQLDLLVEASKEGIIGGTQWYHGQRKKAWESIYPALKRSEDNSFGAKFEDTFCQSHEPVEMGTDDGKSYGRCANCGSSYTDY